MANEQYSKGGLFGAVVDYAGLDSNTIAELSGWRWTANFTEYHFAGSQPATRMTYWLARTAGDYDNYPANYAIGQAQIANFEAVTATARRASRSNSSRPSRPSPTPWAPTRSRLTARSTTS
jgi:hypothetical protein